MIHSMTTNVLDLEAGIAATDSRWSVSTPRFFLCIDNTGFEKIVARSKYLLVFAGAGSLIQEWKDWSLGLPASLEHEPEFSRKSRAVAVTITDMDDASVLFERMQTRSEPNARFTGTGAAHAFAYWQEHGNAIAAVRHAIALDRASGGDVKFFKFSGENNIFDTIRFGELRQMLAREGHIMMNDGSNSFAPVQEAAKTNPEVDSLVKTVLDGDAEICSPCDEMYREWTEDEKRHFRRVAANIAKHLENETG
jgi:sugar/nucleoside kinase (ribokinase family)